MLHWKHASAPAALAGAGGAAGAAAAATGLLHMLLTRLPGCFTLGANLASCSTVQSCERGEGRLRPLGFRFDILVCKVYLHPGATR